MKLFAYLILFLVPSLLQAGLLYGDRQELSVSDNLSNDVRFWEDIFWKYEADQCVYHDSKHLEVVFLVEGLGTTHSRHARRVMKGHKNQIKAALRSLSLGRKPRTLLEKRISSNVPSELKSRRYFRKAINRIRCQRGVATEFRKSLQRSKEFLPMIKGKFRKLALPEDLAYLPHLESGFNNKAHSKVGARGLWQLMPGTARQFMKVSRRRDDRINPYLATNVAARILKDNYHKTRDWPLAITAYNYGINGVVRAIRKYDTNDYEFIRRHHRTRIFGFAAKNFYPSFIAVRNLARADQEGRGRLKVARGDRASDSLQ